MRFLIFGSIEIFVYRVQTLLKIETPNSNIYGNINIISHQQTRFQIPKNQSWRDNVSLGVPCGKKQQTQKMVNDCKAINPRLLIVFIKKQIVYHFLRLGLSTKRYSNLFWSYLCSRVNFFDRKKNTFSKFFRHSYHACSNKNGIWQICVSTTQLRPVILVDIQNQVRRSIVFSNCIQKAQFINISQKPFQSIFRSLLSFELATMTQYYYESLNVVTSLSFSDNP